jgi:ketosteroid isomerase-like protein
MNEQEKSAVTQAILARTSEWVEAMCRLDADGVLELFDDSDVFQVAEHGMILTSATLPGFVRGSYAALAKADIGWEERQVLPLAPDAASMTGIVRFAATPKEGEVATGRVAFLGVFLKRGEAWKLVHAQQMTLSPPEGV